MSTQVIKYHTIRWQIRCQRSTAVQQPSQDYMPDALGSVVRTVSPTDGTSVSYDRRSAYGRRIANYTAPTNPGLNFVGSLGIKRTGLWRSEQSARNRIVSVPDGRWITQVRMQYRLAGEQAYAYANSNPATYTDPSGNSPIFGIIRCLLPCAYYYRSMPDGAAITLCQDLTTCYKPDPSVSVSLNKLLKKCAEAHEKVHKEQLAQGKATVYCDPKTGLLSNHDPSAAECPAIAAGLDCLIANGACKDPNSEACSFARGECGQLAGIYPYPTGPHTPPKKLNCRQVSPRIKNICKGLGDIIP